MPVRLLEVRGAVDTVIMVDFRPPAAPEVSDGTVRWDGLLMGTGRAGHPDLPTATTLLRLPKGSTLEVRSVEGDEVQGARAVDPRMPLAPVAPPWVKDAPRPEPVPDKAVYSADTFYRGGPVAGVEDLGVMGSCQLFRLTVRPLAYNPVSGAVRHYARLTLRLAATLAADVPPLEGVPERYLIVSRPQFREALQPFVQWKRQEGYDVAELYADTHQRDSVRSQIAPFFTEATPLAPAPRYVLLVGDAAQLQAFMGTAHPSEMDDHLTDLPYVNHNGDMLPDALLGRWPVGDTAELGTVLRKTLAYEQGRSLDTAALRRVLLVAGYEQTPPAPTTTNGQVNYLKREITLAHPEVDTVCMYNPQSRYAAAEVAAAIRQGVALLNYTAHCSVGGWTAPAVSISTLDTLPPHMPLLYVNNCCKSNDFGGTGFGEQLLRMPQGGAIGVIGATNSTLWNEDYYWAVGPKLPVSLEPQYQAGAEGAFDRWVGRLPEVETQGELLAAGNLAVTAFGSPYSSFYWQTYCLFGDPALRPCLGVPEQAAVALVGEPRNGQGALHLAGTPLATVTALQDSVLLGVVRLDSLGNATMPLRQQLGARPLVLTATGRNLMPSVDTLEVLSGISRGVALRDVAVVDSVVRCTVENIGTQRLDSLCITLSQSASDSLVGAYIASQMVVIDSLMPSAMHPLTLPIRITSTSPATLLQARLSAVADSVLCSLPVQSVLPDVRPTVALRLLTLDGREVRRLMPGTAYVLSAEVDGQYDSLRLFVDEEVSDSANLHFTTPSPLCRLNIGATLYRGAWQHTESRWLVPGERLESFEEGFASHPWDTRCRVPWVLDSNVSYSGQYSARTGAIGHDQTSDLSLSVYLPHDDTVSFWAKLSTEPQHDLLLFLVDGVRQQPVLWGNISWRQYKYRLPAGRHTLVWRYLKDHSTSQGQDCAWIDDVRLPMAQWEVPAGWQCVDTTVSVPAVAVSMQKLSVYPNPASDRVSLWVDEPMEVRVVDAAGRRVATFSLSAGRGHAWDVSALPSGVYFAEGQGTSGVSRTKIIIYND